jgi:hypothetical protein
MVDVTAQDDVAGPPGEDVDAAFLVTNMGYAEDGYECQVADSLGWDLNPRHVVVQCDPLSQTEIHVSVSVPGDAEIGSSDPISMQAVSMTDPGLADRDTLRVRVSPSVGIGAQGGRKTRLGLEGAAPNPFVTATNIGFTLGQPGPLRLAIFDVGGRWVRTLVEGGREAGHHTVRWDGLNASGQVVPPGIYFCRLEAEGTRALVMIARCR